MKEKIAFIIIIAIIALNILITAVYAIEKYDVLNKVYNNDDNEILYQELQRICGDIEAGDIDYDSLTVKQKANLYTNIQNYNKLRPNRQITNPGFVAEDIENDKDESVKEKIKESEKNVQSGGSGSSNFTFPTLGQMIQSALNFINFGKENDGDKIFTDDDMKGPVIGLGRVLMVIGIVVLLVVTAVMGIKYMTVAPSEQAKLKEQLVGVAVSAAVVFGAFSIWEVTVRVLESIG